MPVLQLDDLKTRQRATWDARDYSACSASPRSASSWSLAMLVERFSDRAAAKLMNVRLVLGEVCL